MKIILERILAKFGFYRIDPRNPRVYVETLSGSDWLMVNGTAVAELKLPFRHRREFECIKTLAANRNYWMLRDNIENKCK